eukprot:m.307343 g.307343  ORF g.307343 m.307343 type:complete len:123 (+) comp42169_c0_seq1:37-405(+)
MAQIGQTFVTSYYQTFDSNRAAVASLYRDTSSLTFEGTEHKGQAAIVTKLTSLPFQTVQHGVTTTDCQMIDAESLLVCVMGQLKTDDDPVHGFMESFVLRQFGDSLFIVNQVFRLSLHNLSA